MKGRSTTKWAAATGLFAITLPSFVSAAGDKATELVVVADVGVTSFL